MTSPSSSQPSGQACLPGARVAGPAGPQAGLLSSSWAKLTEPNLEFLDQVAVSLAAPLEEGGGGGCEPQFQVLKLRLGKHSDCFKVTESRP